MELFHLLRSSISGEKLSDEEREKFSSEQLHKLLELSHKHDVAHLLALGIKRNELTSKVDMDIEEYIFKAVYRHERKRYDLENLCNALEKARIPFMPLKGAIVVRYYPEEWMRTSCDIDILVSKENSEKAMSVLVDEYGYTYGGKSSHDISLYTPSKVHVELHYDLIEEGRINRSSEILITAWDTATIREGFSYWYEMPDEMLYFYHISHMAKHLIEGGCGIRPFIDLWILENIHEANAEKRNMLLEQGDLLKFANVVRKLSKIWFESEDKDPISEQVELYILHGGVYGNTCNRIMLQQQKKGGRINYALSKIFIPYDVIKFHYPILQKYRWLTPIMEVRRWCKLIFCGHLKRITREIHYSNNITPAEAAGMQKFLNSIGL